MSKPQYIQDKDGRFKGSLGRPSNPPTPRPERQTKPETPRPILDPAEAITPAKMLLARLKSSHPTLSDANETLPHAPLDTKNPNRYPTARNGFTFPEKPLQDVRGGWETSIPQATRTGQEKKEWANLKRLVGHPLLVQPIGRPLLEVERPWGRKTNQGVRVLVTSPMHGEVFDSVWQTPTMVSTFGDVDRQEELIPCRLVKLKNNQICAFRLSPAELKSMAEFCDYHGIYPYAKEFDHGWDEEWENPVPFDDGGLGWGGEPDDYCVVRGGSNVTSTLDGDDEFTTVQETLFEIPVDPYRSNSHTL